MREAALCRLRLVDRYCIEDEATGTARIYWGTEREGSRRATRDRVGGQLETPDQVHGGNSRKCPALVLLGQRADTARGAACCIVAEREGFEPSVPR